MATGRPKPSRTVVQLDLAAVQGMTERQRLKYLLALNAEAEAEHSKPAPPGTAAPSKRAKPTQPVAVHPCAPDEELERGDSDGVRLCLVNGQQAEGEVLAALKAYKLIADELLPDMRRDSHLHNLVFSRHSHSLLLSSEGVCHGGATFRLLQLGDSLLVMNVLVVVVDQSEGVCRRGYGTRIVEALRRLLTRDAARLGLRGMMLASVDDGEKATNFWHKQKLRATLAGAQALEALHEAEPKLVHTYEGSTPMAWELKPARAARALAPLRATAVNSDSGISAGLEKLSLRGR